MTISPGGIPGIVPLILDQVPAGAGVDDARHREGPAAHGPVSLGVADLGDLLVGVTVEELCDAGNDLGRAWCADGAGSAAPRAG